MAQPKLATTAPPAAAAEDDGFGTVNVVETPTSPSSAFTLSRFEFEAGTKGNEGTKILMVEWDAAAAAAAAAATTATTTAGNNADGADDKKKTQAQADAAKEVPASLDDWEVTWDGKEALAILPIRDPTTSPSTCRIYFLLPPKAPIPTLITISPKSSASADHQPPQAAAAAAVTAAAGGADLHTKPLPAIFPDGLHANGAPGHDKGTRGVLHTIWARARLEQLEDEIVAEAKANGESVGLEMALQERQWILDHFGLMIDTSSAEAIPLAPLDDVEAASPAASPRSPVGGRLGEKLRGLKLATSPAELAAVKGEFFFLCGGGGGGGDVQWGVGGGDERMVLLTVVAANQTQAKRITALAPDSAPAAGFPAGMASLSAVMQTGQSAPPRSHDTEEDLFALPMSPRSPEMAMSPFSLLKS